MGQRLVINIISNGETLANAYYHWDAYTETAANTTLKIVSDLSKIEQSSKQMMAYMSRFPVSPEERLKNLDLFTAYLALENTGAGILKDDEEEFKKIFKGYNYRKGENRNFGLISITPKTIQENISWAEGTVDIDISENKIKFDVIGVCNKDELEEDDEIKQIDIEDLMFFKFSEINDWYKKIIEICNDTNYPYYQDKDNPDIFYQVIA